MASVYTDLTLVVDAITLSLRAWPCAQPSRPPLVLLPGTGETAEDWDLVASRLSARRPVFAMDLRGHGRSDWPGTYSIDLFADDVSAALGQLGDDPVVLVGHSLGGLVACKVAVLSPARVHALVLEDVGIPHPRAPATPLRPEGQLPFDWAVVEQVRPEIDDPDPRWAEIVTHIQAPTMVIGGGPSSFVPQEHLVELVERVPEGLLTTIDAGHLIHRSKPEEFIEQVDRFLDAQPWGT